MIYYIKTEIKGENYERLIDYAFETCDSFMLVYFRYKNRKYSHNKKIIKEMLNGYKLKYRRNASKGETKWPGTITWDTRNEYTITFYRIENNAKEILKTAGSNYSWSRCSDYPDDLCFFRGDECWYMSTTHERIAGFANPTKEDLEFIKSLGVEFTIDNSCWEYKEEGLTGLVAKKVNRNKAN